MQKDIKILIVDDETNLRELLASELGKLGYHTKAAKSAGEAEERLAENDYNIVMLDIKLPDMDGISLLKKIKADGFGGEVIMMTGFGTIDNAVNAMREGAFHYLTKPFRLAEVEVLIEKAKEKLKLGEQTKALRVLAKAKVDAPETMIYKSQTMQKVLDTIKNVAPSSSPVLIEGESGTGKELIAHAIYAQSKRAAQPYLAINCGALSETLLLSELFGHEKGSFTGAHERKLGLFEVANNGTLFLDEIGDMPMGLQATLLRVIESGEFMRLGGSVSIKVDVRIISATNKKLQDEIKQKHFREDLFHRLNVINIKVPPLRERKEDVALLVSHFFLKHRVSGKIPPTVPDNIMQALVNYQWPGNIRELENLVERWAILAASAEVSEDDVPPYILKKSLGTTDKMSLSQIERNHIIYVMQETKGNKSQAAKMLGISLQTLYNKIKEHEIYITGE